MASFPNEGAPESISFWQKYLKNLVFALVYFPLIVFFWAVLDCWMKPYVQRCCLSAERRAESPGIGHQNLDDADEAELLRLVEHHFDELSELGDRLGGHQESVTAEETRRKARELSVKLLRVSQRFRGSMEPGLGSGCGGVPGYEFSVSQGGHNGQVFGDDHGA